jgi:nicotinamidase-related amidase
MKIVTTEDPPHQNSSKIAVVIIDMQEKLLQEISLKYDLLKSVEILIQSADLFGIPIVITEQAPNKLGGTDKSLYARVTKPTILAKKSFSVFGCDEFRNTINTKDISHIILAGLETSICIYLSALDALKCGINVTVLYDCVGARRDSDARIALKKLEHAGCHIVALESFLYGYIENTDHPNFKEVTKLVRDR